MWPWGASKENVQALGADVDGKTRGSNSAFSFCKVKHVFKEMCRSNMYNSKDFEKCIV